MTKHTVPPNDLDRRRTAFVTVERHGIVRRVRLGFTVAELVRAQAALRRRARSGFTVEIAGWPSAESDQQIAQAFVRILGTKQPGVGWRVKDDYTRGAS
jgi:hypothetical protein